MRRAELRREMMLLAVIVAIGGMYTSVDSVTATPFAASAQSLMGAASVSISAAIAPNPDNTLASQLRAKEEQLAAREAALNTRAAAPALVVTDWGFWAFVLSATLLVLVGLNFYFDMRRAHAFARARLFAVDLRTRS